MKDKVVFTHDCKATTTDGKQVEPAFAKPVPAEVLISTPGRLGANARIAHYGPSNYAQIEGRIYVCSRTLKPEVIGACKTGGVHIQAWMALFRPTLLLVPNRRDASIRFRINIPKQQISQPIKPPKLINETSGDVELQLLI